VTIWSNTSERHLACPISAIVDPDGRFGGGRDSFGPLCAQDGLFEVADRGRGVAHRARRQRVERILLGLDRPAGARVGVIPSHALRDEPPHADRLPGRQQVVGALGAQPVGHREVAVEVAGVHLADRGQLVDDRLRLGARYRLGHLVGRERVGDDRHSAHLAQHRLLGRAARHAVHLMPRRDQPRHQLPADRASRSCHKHSHRSAPRRGPPSTP
jgi:hypothetical protein